MSNWMKLMRKLRKERGEWVKKLEKAVAAHDGTDAEGCRAQISMIDHEIKDIE